MSRFFALVALVTASLPATAQAADGWLAWRGPGQGSAITGAGLRTTLSQEDLAWTAPLGGRGTPVIADGRLYTLAVEGEGESLRELLVAVDARSGEVLWKRAFRDFLSDIIYERYSIGSPTVDPETGNVFVHATNGVVSAWTPDGEPLWEVSMPETLGRLSFPNGRTGSVVVDGDRVILHFITANWAKDSPGRDRFYAFDKRTGELAWASTPGLGPRDSSFSTPYLEWRDGRRLLYAGTGCGHIVAVDAATGEPVWRAPMADGGVNISPAVDGDTLVAIHDVENLDDGTTGRMVAFDLSAPPTPTDEGKVLSTERWRADLSAFTSSPVVADGRVYETIATGELVALDLATGAEAWRLKLSEDQLHASPLWADGLLYVPMHDGALYVIRPGDTAGTVVSKVQLDGLALGAPSAWGGMLYVQTTAGLYAFAAGDAEATIHWPTPEPPPLGPPTQLQVRPAEALLAPGERVSLRALRLDVHGQTVDTARIERIEAVSPGKGPAWSAPVDLVDGALVARADAGYGAGLYLVHAGGMTAPLRVRTQPSLFALDFEDAGDEPAPPPRAWASAGKKWEIVPLDGGHVLAKTLDNLLFQRSIVYLGPPDAHDYTLRARVRTEGNARSMSDVGLVNQRYLFALKGNQRQLEVSSNYERLRHGVRFDVVPGTWYHLVTRVTHTDDGSALVQAKAWAEGTDEPTAWTLSFVDPDGFPHGAPGIYGFVPQNLHRVVLDDVALIPTEAGP